MTNIIKKFPVKFNTPLQSLKKISADLCIDLRIKMDQYVPFFEGGSKARKIMPVLNKVISNKYDSIVTAGSSSSNHARVVALACAQLGIKCKIIIHDLPDYSNMNLRLMQMAGAELIFCHKPDVAEKMDTAMKQFSNMGLKPYYIWGGGHCVEGAYAYYLALKEFKEQSSNWDPEYIIIPSGTGGTQAGIHLAAEEMYPSCKVYGISVARDCERGKKAIENSISELRKFLDVTTIEKEISFLDEWVGAGYGMSNSSIDNIISYCAKNEGILLDHIYTGKAFLSLFEMVKDKRIPVRSKVLFWHTGSCFNLFKIKV